MTALVIGVAGRSGVGKDTFANLLADELIKQGYNVNLYAFAQPVKHVYSVMFDGDPFTDDRQLKERTIIDNSGNRTMRSLLQIIGTEFGRNLIHPHIWVNHMKRRVEKLSTEDREVVIITDIRFPDELEFVGGELGGTVFDIQRNEPKPLTKWQWLWRRITFQQAHPSETVKYRKQLPKFGGIVVDNNGSRAELPALAKAAARTVIPRFNTIVRAL